MRGSPITNHQLPAEPCLPVLGWQSLRGGARVACCLFYSTCLCLVPPVSEAPWTAALDGRVSLGWLVEGRTLRTVALDQFVVCDLPRTDSNRQGHVRLWLSHEEQEGVPQSSVATRRIQSSKIYLNMSFCISNYAPLLSNFLSQGERSLISMSKSILIINTDYRLNVICFSIGLLFTENINFLKAVLVFERRILVSSRLF